MPHLMIAGSTGSGKSVCINSILSSILVHASPNDVRMILIDPKVVELSVYNGIPHLISPVITDCKKAAGALNWAVAEMQRRYKLFVIAQVRDIKSYNAKCDEHGEPYNKIPLILIVIDELAELMMVASKEVETYISRLAALARAAGLHLLIATQRPSVDVITGVIKANIGSRIAFAVTSGVDSRTILDQYGAEELLGKGDMLYSPMTAPQPVRGQGALVEDEEVEAIVDFLNNKYGSMYDEQIIKDIEMAAQEPEKSGSSGSSSSDSGCSGSGDNLFEEAVEIVLAALTEPMLLRKSLHYLRVFLYVQILVLDVVPEVVEGINRHVMDVEDISAHPGHGGADIDFVAVNQALQHMVMAHARIGQFAAV